MMESPTTKYKLMELMHRTGYPLTQHNGQRRFGPPPDWTGPPPPRGCEIFTAKLPRDIFEDELVPLFSQVGKIYEMRLMMDFSGSNRGYAFVTYSTKAEASSAIKTLNGYEIRPRRKIGVVKSVDNCRLCVREIPTDKTKEEIREELSKRVSGIVDVILYQNLYNKKLNRGFAFIEFKTHKDAAMARRTLVPGCVKLWDQEVTVDWAEPEPDIEDDQMKRVKVLYVRNFEIRTTPETIKKIFENAINNKIERIKKIYDYAFIHFYQREHAELAMAKLQYTDIDGSKIEIKWAKPVDRDLYKIQKAKKGNAKFNNNLDFTQTLLLYTQHLAKKEYAKSPKDEGIGSLCHGDSPCCSPLSLTQTEYPLATAKLEAICRRYNWPVPLYKYQKYIDTTGVELWICSIELPQVGLPLLLSGPQPIGPICTSPCFSYQQAQLEAAERAIHILKMLKVEVAQPAAPVPVFSPVNPIIQPLPNCLRMPYEYPYQQSQTILPVMPTVWRPL